jgi:hypothetical protein
MPLSAFNSVISSASGAPGGTAGGGGERDGGGGGEGGVNAAGGSQLVPVLEEVLMVVKWGGVLTHAGRQQAEDLGKIFRMTMYPR